MLWYSSLGAHPDREIHILTNPERYSTLQFVPG